MRTDQVSVWYVHGLNGCQRTFQNVNTYRNHVSSRHTCSFHHQVIDSSCHIHSDPADDATTSEGNDLITSDLEDLDVSRTQDTTASCSPVSDSVDLTRSAATWILKVKEKYKLPQVAMQGIIQDVTRLFQVYLGDLHSTVVQELTTSQVDADTISTISPLFEEGGAYGQPFRGLDTEHRQLAYFRDKFAMIVSYITLVAVDPEFLASMCSCL